MKKIFLRMTLFMILAIGVYCFVNQSFARTSSSWSALGDGTDSYIRSLAVYNNELYVGGYFTTSPGSRIAKWNGSSWSSVAGTGINNGRATSMVVYNNKLYIGGTFTIAGGSVANYIAVWDGSSLSAVGTAVTGNVYSLAVYNNELYVGGNANIDGAPANYIVKWNDSSWTPVGAGTELNSYVNSLCVYNNELYVGGEFTSVNGNYISKWNGSSWSKVGDGTELDSFVYSLAVYDNELYIGGIFTIAGGGVSNYIAVWDNNSLGAVGTTITGNIYSLVVYDNELYAGGDFTGDYGNCISKWNGFSWSAVGSGMNYEVDALTVYNDELYVGGDFTTAGGISANYIASWFIDYLAPDTTASPIGGTYTSPQTVTLSATDADSTVVATYYTIDGTDPTTASTIYSNPIVITQDTTLKFFSVDSKGNTEEIKTETYMINIVETNQAEDLLKAGQKFTLESALNEQTISGQSLTINFTKLPTKLTKNSAYWMKWNKSTGYPNKTFLKKWKLKTNLYKYKVKKSSQKFKIKVSFKFTKKQLKKYLKKNKSATKANLFLKYKKGTGTWQNINTTFTDAKIIKKDKKFIVKYFTKYPIKTQYFAIGVK